MSEQSSEPTSDRTIGELVCQAIAHAAASYCEIDPGAHDIPGATPLHDARVALRRIRSYLRTFQTVFDPGFASTVRSDLGWFATLLGSVRNVDVIAERIAAHEDVTAQAAACSRLLAVVASERSAAIERLLEARRGDRYDVVRNHLDLLASWPPLAPRAGEPADAALANLLSRPWRDLRGQARVARKTTSEADLHALRIRAKELRYACEVSAPVLGTGATRVARAASSLQTRLGNHRDALATADLLEQVGSPDPQAAFFAGQLVVLERRTALEVLDGLGRDLRRLRRRWRQLSSESP